MTLRRVKKLSRKEDYGNPDPGAVSDIYTAEPARNSQLYRTLAYSGGTLPRSHKQRSLMKWKTLTDSPEHERRIITLEKQDGEAFGFEIQTYGLHHRDENAMEMCTFVCRVRENTPAELGGLRQGDTITSINGTQVNGFRHRDIVDLIKSSGNCLRLETVYGTSIRRAELETRLQYLKQTLQEKWEEYRSLMVQEQRLVHGIVSKDAGVYDAIESVRASLFGQGHNPSPSARRQPHCSGSSATEDGDEPIYQTCIFDPLDAGSDDSRSAHSNEVVLAKKALTRSVSAKAGHNGVTSSSSWEKCNNQSTFGTLPRKSRRKSLRKRLLKYIPGLNRSVEEEESQL
ncbi:general receptor for phosphoinositides 1-associated scaffold protein [Scyliorhinus canicula]|uniref:general receptor for phosphoinositides 1-associated scaffold protein n=1 Tax=Scyliorhinus canicula TaxID=7830 RepID=UPI0018F2C526|nr:general receptor for phosphoinositides 1-associated scaffold protein [Scyliorhinus canicula]